MNRQTTGITATAAIAAAATLASAQTFTYNEFVDGDLSNNIDAPTDLGVAGLGESTVRLEVFESTTPDGDFDVFTFQIQQGEEFAGLILNDYQGIDELAFLALAEGPTFPVDPNTGDPTAFLGGVLFGSGDADVGDDLFPLLQLPFAGGTGFSGNLGEGSYSIFVQQTGPVTEAELGIVVIPAPASAAVLGLAGLAAARRRR